MPNGKNVNHSASGFQFHVSVSLSKMLFKSCLQNSLFFWRRLSPVCVIHFNRANVLNPLTKHKMPGIHEIDSFHCTKRGNKKITIKNWWNAKYENFKKVYNFFQKEWKKIYSKHILWTWNKKRLWATGNNVIN